MSDDNSMLDMNRRSRLTADITFLMLKGAGYAAIVFFGLWILIAVLAAVGGLLPDAAREASDPSPWSALEVIEPGPASELG